MYQIPASRNTKVALNAQDLLRIYNYKDPDPEINRGMDYWWLLYFGNGMNLKDAALLKYGNKQGDFIIFRRAKTDRRLGSTSLPISVYIDSDLEALLYRRANPKVDEETYLLPILHPGMNPLEIHDAVKGFIRFVNNCAKAVFAALGIEKKGTTKVTRHSFITQQKRNGATIIEIQEAVGHAHPSTTQYYADSFEQDAKRSFASNTSKFKRQQSV